MLLLFEIFSFLFFLFFFSYKGSAYLKNVSEVVENWAKTIILDVLIPALEIKECI